MENFEMPPQQNNPEEIRPAAVKKEIVKPSLEIANEQREKECRQHERDLVVKNPELVGINFDHDYIVDTRSFWPQERYIQYLQERDGQISDEVRSAVESGRAQKILSERGRKRLIKGHLLMNIYLVLKGNYSTLEFILPVNYHQLPRLKHLRLNQMGLLML
jgi:hypothetical protein